MNGQSVGGSRALEGVEVVLDVVRQHHVVHCAWVEAPPKDISAIEGGPISLNCALPSEAAAYYGQICCPVPIQGTAFLVLELAKGFVRCPSPSLVHVTDQGFTSIR